MALSSIQTRWLYTSDHTPVMFNMIEDRNEESVVPHTSNV